jgi:zinc D-Ala-D-Ala carboxypeptidase
MSDDWRWDPFFKKSEMACKHTGKCNMNPKFMDLLVQLRIAYKKPMVVTSGYRDPSHPAEQIKAEPGTHSQGIATDIAVRGADAVELLKLALQLGFKGIGVKQKGEGRFLHLDMREQPAIWSY